VAEFIKKGKIDGNARKAWWAKFTGLLSLLSAISFIIAGVPHADAEKFTSGTEEAPLTPTLKAGAQKLYTVTDKGTTVVVTDGKTKTGTTSRPGLLFASGLAPTLAPGQFVWTPEKSPEGPVSILFSSADSQAYVYRNGVDNVWMYPEVLGREKRLFENGARPRALRLVASKASTTGVVMSTYIPAGDIPLGSLSQTEPSAKELTRRAKMATDGP
jgi:hypothetical protein